MDEKLVDAAVERLSKLDPSIPLITKEPSRLRPKNWPAPVKTVVVAALTAALVSAKVPAAIAAAITTWFFGG